MEGRKLSPRLLSILALLKPCSCLADVGSDHGYLICQAVSEGKAAAGIAVEMNDDPYKQTILAVVEAFLMDEVSVRKGDGLQPLAPDEADAVCIAGMGGKTIADILLGGRDKLGSVRQLVLQPNVDASRVRMALLELGFAVEDETLVRDGGFIYQIISAVPGAEDATAPSMDLFSLEYGAINLGRGGPLLAEVLRRDVMHLEKIAAQLLRSKDSAAADRRSEVLKKVSALRAILAKTVG